MLWPMTRDEVCARFIESVPYTLYPFQEEALLAWFDSPGGVMVCAPTGMGKTLIAEAAVFEALHTRRRLYYTTPLIALTDQKYRELQGLAERWGFSRDDVGLITGNRRINPDALIRVVVAEILLNHLLSPDANVADMEHVGAVVMDEFHNFNDFERGIVWELSLVLLPAHVRVMLLSATVGNPLDFRLWLKKEHGRDLALVASQERRVPLEFVWVPDKLLTELLPEMVSSDDAANRTPALVFCFNRDECWEVAERLKGLSVTGPAARAEVEAYLSERRDDFAEGVGPKLRQMLVRGVGVHHAGVLPKHKIAVEELFNRKLVPFVICTETLAAGINLPARSVVMSTLLKGKHGEKKPVPSSTAHQIFGRAGRPQFDTKGYVYAIAHEDDARLAKWRKKYEQIDPNSKDPGIMRARKELERKKPSRRKTEQYWSEGLFKQLIEAGPARLFSRSMIAYSVLIYLLTRFNALDAVREFLGKRFNTAERLKAFQDQLSYMLANLEALGYIAHVETAAPDASSVPAPLSTSAPPGPADDPASSRMVGPDRPETEDPLAAVTRRWAAATRVTLTEGIHKLLNFRSVDPLYGAFLAEMLNHSNYDEKVLALESVLEVAPTILRSVRLPETLVPGPLETQVIVPMLVQAGVLIASVNQRADDEEASGGGGEGAIDSQEPRASARSASGPGVTAPVRFTLARDDEDEYADEMDEPRPPTFPELLQLAFGTRLAAPEPIFVQPKWIAGGVAEFDGDFYKFVRARDLVKQEGLILRHLLRLVILAGEFLTLTGDPDYARLADTATAACERVEPQYTKHYLEQAQAARKLDSV